SGQGAVELVIRQKTFFLPDRDQLLHLTEQLLFRHDYSFTNETTPAVGVPAFRIRTSLICIFSRRASSTRPSRSAVFSLAMSSLITCSDRFRSRQSKQAAMCIGISSK